jgi:hypothetical protein
MKKIAILQSNYIPWKGYFDLIAAVDEFILYDDMQYTRRDWRNRNQIKTPQGVQWLTVPVKVKGKYHQLIRETEIDGDEWQRLHWRTIKQNYKKAPYFSQVVEVIGPCYLERSFQFLHELNRTLIETICGYLGITTRISSTTDYQLVDGKTERLVDLCLKAGGSEYISGPSARDYIQPAMFEENAIQLSWFDYAGYPEYPQLWGPVTHGVTILDLMFNCGPDAPAAMKYVCRDALSAFGEGD